MKKILLIGLLLSSFSAMASDFVRYPKNQAVQQLPNADVQIINLWAAYCKPCLKEMPAMSRWYSKQKQKKANVSLVGIALDSHENIQKFLKTTPVSYEIWRYVGKNSREMMRTYGNKVGVLPYTLIRLPKCGKEQAMIGEVDEKNLDKTIAALKAQCKA